MRGDDAAADRQTQPHSLFFRCEERLEYLFQFFLGDTAAHVDDTHNDCAPTSVESGTNEQSALPSVAFRHRVASVDHQIDQDLLKLHRVADDGWQVPRELNSDNDVLIDEIGTDQLQNIPYHFVDAERMRSEERRVGKE